MGTAFIASLLYGVVFLASGVMIRADVSYDVVRSAKWPPAQVDPNVPWTNAAYLACRLNFPAPVLPSTAQEVTHVHIKDHKLVAVDSKIWRIYDLDAATLTTVDLEPALIKFKASKPRTANIDV